MIKLINRAYERAKALLQQNQDKLVELAELLLKKEIVFKEDLETILGKRASQASAPVKKAI